MKVEEAIDILKKHHMWTGEPKELVDVRKENKALDMAIAALEKGPEYLEHIDHQMHYISKLEGFIANNIPE